MSSRSHEPDGLALSYIFTYMDEVLGEMTVKSLGAIIVRDDDKISIASIPPADFTDYHRACS